MTWKGLHFHRKLNAILEFFVHRHSGDVATTKLVKLTYLADLLAVKKLGRPISDVDYIYYDHGPWSRIFHDALDENHKLIARRGWNPFGSPAAYYEFGGDAPDLSPLSESEREILRETDQRWGRLGLNRILDEVYSHEPFTSADFGGAIDLERVNREPDFP
jgi:hypothetical protein